MVCPNSPIAADNAGSRAAMIVLPSGVLPMFAAISRHLRVQVASPEPRCPRNPCYVSPLADRPLPRRWRQLSIYTCMGLTKPSGVFSASNSSFGSCCRNGSMPRAGVGSHLGLRIWNFVPEKAIECENITKIILTFDGILLPLELQAGPLRRSVRKPVTDRRIYKKVGATNSQIEWLRQAIFSDQMDIPSHYGSD